METLERLQELFTDGDYRTEQGLRLACDSTTTSRALEEFYLFDDELRTLQAEGVVLSYGVYGELGFCQYLFIDLSQDFMRPETQTFLPSLF